MAFERLLSGGRLRGTSETLRVGLGSRHDRRPDGGLQLEVDVHHPKRVAIRAPFPCRVLARCKVPVLFRLELGLPRFLFQYVKGLVLRQRHQLSSRARSRFLGRRDLNGLIERDLAVLQGRVEVLRCGHYGPGCHDALRLTHGRAGQPGDLGLFKLAGQGCQAERHQPFRPRVRSHQLAGTGRRQQLRLEVRVLLFQLLIAAAMPFVMPPFCRLGMTETAKKRPPAPKFFDRSFGSPVDRLASPVGRPGLFPGREPGQRSADRIALFGPAEPR